MYSDDWLHLVHILSREQSGADILSLGLFPQTVWGCVSNSTTLEAAYAPTSFVCAIISNVTSPQRKQFTLACGSILEGFLWPLWAVCVAITTGSLSSASSLTMARTRSSNCSISIALILVNALNSFPPELGVQPQTRIRKSVQVILQTKLPASLVPWRHPLSRLPLMSR